MAQTDELFTDYARVAGSLKDELIGACIVTGVELGPAVLDNVDMAGARFFSSVVENCELSSCTFTLGGLIESQVLKSRFISCDLAGVDFSNAVIRDCIFDGCKLSYANFAGAKLIGVRFNGCLVRELTLHDVDVRQVEIFDCDLSGTSFHMVRSRDGVGLDIRGSLIDNCQGLLQVRGVVVDPGQAESIAAAWLESSGFRVAHSAQVDGEREGEIQGTISGDRRGPEAHRKAIAEARRYLGD